MGKITRAELAKRKRIALYKKIIIYGFLAMTILPIISGIFLLYKMNQMEQKLDYVLSTDGGDYLTYRSSKEALTENPNASSGVFSSDNKVNLANADVTSGVLQNTEDDSDAQEGKDESEKTEAKRVYLTFDDGPSIYTGQILDILAANHVKATFFVIGRDEE